MSRYELRKFVANLRTSQLRLLVNPNIFKDLEVVRCLLRRDWAKLMLNIQRATNGGVTFVLSGRIEIEDVAELQRLLALEQVNRQITIDLAEVTLVDREAVKFLANCEADQIKLENCPGYIRRWMDMEKRRNRRPET